MVFTFLNVWLFGSHSFTYRLLSHAHQGKLWLLRPVRKLIELLHQLFFLVYQDGAVLLFVLFRLDHQLHVIFFRLHVFVALLNFLVFLVQHLRHLFMLGL